MHNNYTKIKGLDSGKITSLPNSENVINLHASFQSSPNKKTSCPSRDSFAYDESYHSFLSPVSTVPARNA